MQAETPLVELRRLFCWEAVVGDAVRLAGHGSPIGGYVYLAERDGLPVLFGSTRVALRQEYRGAPDGFDLAVVADLNGSFPSVDMSPELVRVIVADWARDRSMWAAPSIAPAGAARHGGQLAPASFWAGEATLRGRHGAVGARRLAERPSGRHRGDGSTGSSGGPGSRQSLDSRTELENRAAPAGARS